LKASTDGEAGGPFKRKGRVVFTYGRKRGEGRREEAKGSLSQRAERRSRLQSSKKFSSFMDKKKGKTVGFFTHLNWRKKR